MWAAAAARFRTLPRLRPSCPRCRRMFFAEMVEGTTTRLYTCKNRWTKKGWVPLGPRMHSDGMAFRESL